MKIFIIILNYNGKDDTLACLQSLEKVKVSKGYELEVVVVDNGSRDGSVEAINNKYQITNFKQIRNSTIKIRNKLEIQNTNQKKNFEVTMILNDENLGYAGGNNVGINQALGHGARLRSGGDLELGQGKADYVLVLNNDMVVDPDFLKELLAGAERHPRAGLLVPKIYFAKGHEFHKDRYKKSDLGKVIWSAGGGMDWDNVYGINIGIDEVDEGQFDPPGGGDKQVEKASGACVLMSRKMLEEVGGFDEKFFMYYEDDDLSVRAKKAGFEIWYIPKAKVWHESGGTSGVGSALMDYFITRNRLLFGFRYASWRTKLALARESLRLWLGGRKWQRKGVKDFYLGKWEKGSWG